MRLWLLLTGALIVQELVSTNVALLAAHHAGDSALFITLIFVLATGVDFLVGYVVGKWVQRRFGNHRLVKRVERWAARFEKYLGPKSERAVLVLIGLVSYAYVNAFLASWLELSTTEVILWLGVGDALWYGLEWLLILGAASLTTSFINEFYIVVGVSLVLIIGLRFASNRIFRNTPTP